MYGNLRSQTSPLGSRRDSRWCGPHFEKPGKGITMSRIKSIFATLLLTVIAGIVPQAKAATTVEATIVG
jgi:hypothetical protein